MTTFTVCPKCSTSAEYLALLEACRVAIPDDSDREVVLVNALVDCLDQLLRGVSPEELHRILAAYHPPKPDPGD